MNHNITTLIADDHPILLKGLKSELLNLGFHVLEAINGTQSLEIIISKKPTIAILDINMPLLSGFEVISKCQQVSLATKFIIFTIYKEKGFVLKAKKMNISGYLLKDEPFSEVKKCIDEVLKGKFYASPVFNKVLEKEIEPEIERIKFLSPSERTIIRLIAKKKSSKEIAQILTISSRTVEKHRSNIIAKLGLPSSSDSLITWVAKNKELLDSV